MNNDNNNGRNPEPEVMDFFAAGKEARHVNGGDRGERENRSAGSRHRGPSGRYEGLRSGKNKKKHDEEPEREDAAPEPEIVEEAIPEPAVEPVEEAIPEPVIEPVGEPIPEPVIEPVGEPIPEPEIVE